MYESVVNPDSKRATGNRLDALQVKYQNNKKNNIQIIYWSNGT